MNADGHLRCVELSDAGTPHVVVTVVGREGSVPADVGASAIVTADGLDRGTVGGGRVEAAAIRHAAGILAGKHAAGLVRWNLNVDLGMTCGGRVELFFADSRPQSTPVWLFGAGHVAQSLVRVLSVLPVRVTVVDPRREWLDRLPPATDRVLGTVADVDLASTNPRSVVLSITQGHSHDVPVLEAVAASGRSFAMVGVIGSRTKAGALRRELRQRGVDVDRFDFDCPVGLDIGGNHPGEIAVSIAAAVVGRLGVG